VNNYFNQKDWELKLDSSINRFILSDSLKGGLDMNFLHNQAFSTFKKEGFTPVRNELLDTLFSLSKFSIKKLGPVKQILSYQLVVNGEFRNVSEIVLVSFEKSNLFFKISNSSSSENKLVISKGIGISINKLNNINFRFETDNAFYDGYLIVSYFSFQDQKIFVNYSVAPSEDLINSLDLLLSNYQ
tara:strand:- start:32244 stop:32801 length:558 start_codon:yes stop_codon:yes gene_type:complete